MLLLLSEMQEKFQEVFTRDQALLLTQTFGEVFRLHEQMVKAKDFNELKDSVKSLAEAQKRTELRMEELADAQKRTELRMEELADAQKRTEQKVGQLTDAVLKLTGAIDTTRTELGGLSRSLGYALENEAYRALPGFLREHHGIQMQERLIRTDVDGEEINIMGRGEKDGRPIRLIGEAEVRLTSVAKIRALERKIQVVQEASGIEEQIVPILITHYASPQFLERAKAAGILVVQSFEW